ncbi:hypothetical protein F4804DRAFT_308141 [Jackrogersella minutella]|nr:hypothetical protein F4804DRAFT_308141 [Jackrogersella minutella]
MCTGICWVYRCCGCGTVVLKDTSVGGHTCHEARHNRKKGCCRTGVEFVFYERVAREACLLCEVGEEIGRLDADTCDEACSETRVGYCDGEDTDEEEEGGASLRGEDEEGEGSDAEVVSCRVPGVRYIIS